MDCKQRLEELFRERGIEYTAHHHPVAYTAQETAASDHVSARVFAKPVIVVADGEITMIVLAAADRIDFSKVAAACGGAEVRLAEEWEFAGKFPDCELGAMPPLATLYEIPGYVDEELARQETIVFAAGTHTDTISLRYADYAALEHPQQASLCSAA